MNQSVEKLIVMIPAFNERETIGRVIKSIPRQISGIEKVEILVIDDGSTDGTAGVAKSAGADHVVSHHINLGLARAFATGLEAASGLGASVIVNIDADGQYDALEITKLIEPVISRNADIVIGDRQVRHLKFMPIQKKYGNVLGSFIVRILSGTGIADASSGFRAFSQEAARRLNIFSKGTYTHETIIDAASRGLRLAQIPVAFRETARSSGESRLISSVFQHVKNSGMIIVRTFVLYRPLKAFFYLGSVFIIAAVALGIRFLYYYFTIGGQGKIQSLILAGVLAIVGFQILVMGFLADAVSANRRVSEEVLYRLKKRN
ncbi:MAG: hypothetical protein A2826_02100 [Candidatus Doudnabacteria bacterium RIFCSPHIGHO2_01_FULL_43_23]|uniref:Glycosyltransferase 2-like domain-containing protein n=1 Tax=Candidatus Doudnabacteria bacterium RIFCSPHIGHO2_01_FULL_43_23 TaxID=1817822 RepID=A0A1F5NUK4_9BACT|nr:MAG: hypothetical protein A2826_02100 [Candidatus Doudnabacteria bacterium RIFCSPHIGHO2_01_FULL_43_23]